MGWLDLELYEDNEELIFLFRLPDKLLIIFQ